MVKGNKLADGIGQCCYNKMISEGMKHNYDALFIYMDDCNRHDGKCIDGVD